MTKRIAAVVAALVFGVAGYALAAGVSVSLTSTGPQPETVTINWNDTVTYANNDSVEHVVSIPREEFQSPAVPPGGNLEYVFDGRGGNYNVVQVGRRNFSSRVAVRVEGNLSFKASLKVVPFGKTVTLSGQSPYPGTPVFVRSRDAGSSDDYKILLQLTAADDGIYSASIRPKIGARYQARVAADQIASGAVDLAVRPTISIGLSRKSAATGASVTVVGRVLPVRSAERADLLGYDKRRKRWVPLASKAIGSSGRLSYKYKVVEGATRLRIAIRRSAVAAGYVTAESRIVTVTGAATKQ